MLQRYAEQVLWPRGTNARRGGGADGRGRQAGGTAGTINKRGSDGDTLCGRQVRCLAPPVTVMAPCSAPSPPSVPPPLSLPPHPCSHTFPYPPPTRAPTPFPTPPHGLVPPRPTVPRSALPADQSGFRKSSAFLHVTLLFCTHILF